MPKKSKPTDNPDFEKAMQELESLVDKMENGDLGLEESLQYFEKGVKLTRSCQQALKEAEQKVSILLQDSQDFELKDFENKD
ncbi:MAG TPA: exodeoxyribonuclease VII small subunit [Gammaproteobacteria bacterium]|nr:exodeoxyribonuclease VII small subunit [Gammaproteobacteria bacterium]